MIRTQLYRLTAPNGKQYIGVTKTSLSDRISDHIRRHNAIGSALRKHGRENFRIEVLVIGDENYIYKLEKKAIERFDTLAPRGYNLKNGGQGGSHSKETCKKIGNSLRGRILSEEVRRKGSEAKKGDKNPMWNRIFSEKTKQRMSNSQKQRRIREAREGRILCL